MNRYFKYTFIFLLIASSSVLLIDSNSWAVSDFRGATSPTGGGTGAVDAISGTNLADGDKLFVVTASGQSYIYNLDSDSALSEDSTNYSVIAPDLDPGDKRWILMWSGGRVVIPDSTIDQGDNSIVGTLAWHIIDASGNPTTVTILPGTYDLSTDVTVPSTMNLKFEKGGLIAPADTDTELTVYSPENIIASSRQQIIDTSSNSTDPMLFTTGGTVYPGWFGALGDGSTDDLTAFTTSIAAFKSGGGGTYHIPRTGSGYKTSSTLTFDEINNMRLEIADDITLTATTQMSLIAITGDSTSPSIDNVEVIGFGYPVLDGNGDGISYSYGDDSPQFYDTLFIQYAKNVHVSGIRATDGLINSCRIYASQNIVIENSIFDNSRYDNGLTVIRPPADSIATYANWDGSTHNNAIVRNCTAYSNNDYGLTVGFHAPGTIVDGNFSFDNGHDELSGGGGISIEDDNVSPDTYALPATVTNNHVLDNLNKGIFITADYVVMSNNIVRGTVKFTGADANEFSGNGLYIPSGTRVYDTGSQFIDNDNNGIRGLGDPAGVFLDIHLNGTKVTGNGTKGIYFQGVDNAILSDIHVNSNTSDGLAISNNGYNSGAGTVRISNSEFSNNSGTYGAYVAYVEDVKISSSEAIGNAIGTAGFRIGAASVGIIERCRSDGVIGHNVQASVTNGYLIDNIGVQNMGTTGRHGVGAAAPTSGTFRQGEIIYNITPTTGTAPGWMCIHSGTFSAATDNTGDTDGSTPVITGMTDTSDFALGQYVDVSAGFPSTGPYRVLAITSTTMTLDTNSDSSESNITVNTSDPTFESMANLS